MYNAELLRRLPMPTPLTRRLRPITFGPYAGRKVFGSTETVFEASNRRLLLLGGAGSGKSVETYRLALALLTEAAREADGVVPIIVRGSEWDAETDSIETKVQQTLGRVRSMRREDPQLAAWAIEHHKTAILIDGLDETLNLRRAMISLNELLDATNGLNQAVFVTMRNEAFLRSIEGDQPQWPHVTAAAEPESVPLRAVFTSWQQYASGLPRLEEAVAKAVTVIKADPTLREIMRVPFYAALLPYASGATPADVSPDDVMRMLVSRYFDQHFLGRNRKSRLYLANIARMLVSDHLTMFDSSTWVWRAPSFLAFLLHGFIACAPVGWIMTHSTDPFPVLSTVTYSLVFFIGYLYWFTWANLMERRYRGHSSIVEMAYVGLRSGVPPLILSLLLEVLPTHESGVTGRRIGLDALALAGVSLGFAIVALGLYGVLERRLWWPLESAKAGVANYFRGVGPLVPSLFLRRLVHQGVLHRQGRRYEFSHPIMRDTLAEEGIDGALIVHPY